MQWWIKITSLYTSTENRLTCQMIQKLIHSTGKVKVDQKWSNLKFFFEIWPQVHVPKIQDLFIVKDSVEIFFKF